MHLEAMCDQMISKGIGKIGDTNSRRALSPSLTIFAYAPTNPVRSRHHVHPRAQAEVVTLPAKDLPRSGRDIASKRTSFASSLKWRTWTRRPEEQASRNFCAARDSEALKV